jgi:hypothetical protein
MKTILFFAAMFGIMVALAFSRKPNVETDCEKCKGTFCSCDVTCGEGTIKKCNCDVFTCVCWCESTDPKNQSYYLIATADERQMQNMAKAETYFRNLGQPKHRALADVIKDLRDAQSSKDLNKYLRLADIVESSYHSLLATEKKAWETWSETHLAR